MCLREKTILPQILATTKFFQHNLVFYLINSFELTKKTQIIFILSYTLLTNGEKVLNYTQNTYY